MKRLLILFSSIVAIVSTTNLLHADGMVPKGKVITSETVIARINFYSWFRDSLKVCIDSKHIAYAAEAGEKYNVIVDAKEGQLYDGIGAGTITFSPDSKHTAYAASSNDKLFFIIDGKEGPPYENLGGDIVFSPDSKHKNTDL